MHTHAHTADPRSDGTLAAAADGQRRLGFVLGLTALYVLVEVVGGLLTGSLVLLADAGHMLADVLGLAMALLAMRFARRPATPAKTYGFYRAEILAALATTACCCWGLPATSSTAPGSTCGRRSRWTACPCWRSAAAAWW